MILSLICMICFIDYSFAQTSQTTVIDPLTGMIIYSGSSLPYTPVLPPPPYYIPSARDMINAGELAVRNSVNNGSSSVSTNGSADRNTTRSAAGSAGGSSRTDKPCHECGGDKRCINWDYITHVGYCHGSGKCRACSGSGYMQNPYGGIGDKIKCTYCWTGNVGKCGRCHGTGKCSSCNGTGKSR